MLLAPQDCSPQYAELMRQAEQNPLLAASCATVLPKREQQEEVLRTAFNAAPPAVALKLLDRVMDKPWLGAIGLYRAMQITRDADPAIQEKLLRLTALHNPSVALRDFEKLPAAVAEDVFLATPGEAIAIASGSSGTAARMLQAMDDNPKLKRIAQLARNNSIDLPTRQRAAVLLAWMPEAEAVRAARNDRTYFNELAAHPGTDHPLGAFALRYMRDAQQNSGVLSQWKPRELYLLLVYGRAEVDEKLFRTIWDRTPGMASLAQSGNLPKLRAFLSDALAYGRFEKLPAALFTQAMHGVDSLEEMTLAAEVIDNAPKAQLPAMAQALLKEPDSALYGLLAARLLDRLPDEKLRARGESFHRFLDPPMFLSAGKTSLHRYFFYDDDDGVISFEAFRHSYQNAPGWKFEDKGGYVHVKGSNSSGRSLEIYANVPIDLGLSANHHRAEESAARQKEVSRLLEGREPNVIVHRGHAFHLEKTLRYLTPSARLVFLGSCRGMENVDAVIHASNGAQMIATRGTGSHTVNDPLLKALNEQLLQGTQINWPKFWQTQRAHFQGNALFNDYIPPYQNTAAILLKAYYSYLSN